MKDNQHILLAILMGVLLTVSLTVFHYDNPLHTIVTQLILIEIIIGVLFYNKYVIPITIGAFVVHMITDGIHLGGFPVESVFESIVQGAILYLLYYVLHLRTTVQKRYQTTIDATQLGTWEWNLITNEIVVNDRWCTMLGYQPEELSPSQLTRGKT